MNTHDFLSYIEKFSMDRRFYCHVPDMSAAKVWELSYNRPTAAAAAETAGAAFGGGRWGIREHGSSDWEYLSREALISKIDSLKLNTARLEGELSAKVKTMVVFASLMNREAVKLLGQSTVDKALKDYDRFAQTLLQTIQNMVPEKDDAAETKSGKRDQHLSLVRANKPLDS